MKRNILMVKHQKLTLKGQIHLVISKIQKRKLALLWYKTLKKYLLPNELKKGRDRILQNQKNKREEGGKVNMKIMIPFLKNPF